MASTRSSVGAILGTVLAIGFFPTSALAAEPSAEYRAVLRRTLEHRRGRKELRAVVPLGVIVPYPMPPTLIIRHTRETHDEIEGLLGLLRR